MAQQVRNKRSLIAVAGITVVAALLLNPLGTADAKHEEGHVPANKVAVAASEFEVSGEGERVLLMRTHMRNPASKALQISVTAECSILTELITGGTGPSDMAEATGRVEVWVEIDGTPVPGQTLRDIKGHIAPTLVSGRLPSTDDEVLLGGKTLDFVGRDGEKDRRAHSGAGGGPRDDPRVHVRRPHWGRHHGVERSDPGRPGRHRPQRLGRCPEHGAGGEKPSGHERQVRHAPDVAGALLDEPAHREHGIAHALEIFVEAPRDVMTEIFDFHSR